jgi:chromatin segregation and condensation protein Rec8/ScpA/Scc1 (kleisin family)
VGFFEEDLEPGAGVNLPSVDLLDFHDHVDMSELQEELIGLVTAASGKSTIRHVASQMDLGDVRRTVALVFMACLFLEMDSKVALGQREVDVAVSIWNYA